MQLTEIHHHIMCVGVLYLHTTTIHSCSYYFQLFNNGLSESTTPNPTYYYTVSISGWAGRRESCCDENQSMDDWEMSGGRRCSHFFEIGSQNHVLSIIIIIISSQNQKPKVSFRRKAMLCGWMNNSDQSLMIISSNRSNFLTILSILSQNIDILFEDETFSSCCLDFLHGRGIFYAYTSSLCRLSS